MPPIPPGVDPITYIPPAAKAAAANGATVAQQVAANPIKTTTPTVVTDANIREDKIPDIQQNAQKTLQQYKGTNGALTNPDGTPVAAPAGSQQSSNGLYYDKNGNTYNAPPAADGTTTTPGAGSSTPAPGSAGAPADTAGDNEYDTYLKSLFSDNPSTPTAGAAPANDPYISMLSQMKATSDASTQTMIEATQKQFAQREAQLAATNDASHRGLMQALIANGESRYAPILAGQRLSADETSHILAMSSIDAEESAAVAQLQKAQSDQDYQTMGKELDHLDSLRSDKLAAAGKLADSAASAAKALNDAAQHVQDQKDTIVQDLAKGGAPADVIKAATAAPDVAGAIAAGAGYFQDPTSDAGQYQAYVKDATAKGLTPMGPSDFLLNQKAKEAAVAETAKNNSDAAYTASDKTQQALEQQYRQVLSKEFSARTGALGIENAKVNQANHLNSLFTQYYDPKTGNYNIPTAQYAELAIGLANMLSGTGQSSDSDRAEIKSKTAAGDIKGAIQFITGVPQNGNTQAIIKNLVDSVDRQAQTAERNRQAALDDMKAQAPTDLEPSRVDALNKSTQMVSYEGQARVSKAAVDTYVKANPAEADSIAKMYEVPGATDQDIEDYLKAQGKIQ